MTKIHKKVIIKSQGDVDSYFGKLRASAENARGLIRELAAGSNPLTFLYQVRFDPVGCDPMDTTRKLNLIEQLNQTFTYAASLKAASYLLKQRPAFTALTLNLGTTSGWDIESIENGGLVAEIFAAVNPQNNDKLNKDVKKVATAEVQHRYVFFMCPGVGAGPYKEVSVPAGINVISLGCELW